MVEERTSGEVLNILNGIRGEMGSAENVELRDGAGALSLRLRRDQRTAEFGVLDLNQPFLRVDIGFGRTFIDEDASEDELESVMREFADVSMGYLAGGAKVISRRWLRSDRAVVTVDGKVYVLWPYGSQRPTPRPR